MKIKKLTLYTNKLEQEKQFYTQTLGFPLADQQTHCFSVQIGHTVLTFETTEKAHLYHYCFLIPANQLTAGIHWLQQKVDLVRIEEERIIQHFETWNADSVYFYDASGNLAEFIVRYDLENNYSKTFDLSSILCVNEIGMPVKNIVQTNQLLETQLNSFFWKGDQERFGTNGNQEGLLLLPNYQIKKHWFPTDLPIQPSPFKAVVEVAGKAFKLNFEEKNVLITPL